VPPPPIFKVEESVPEKVNVLLIVRVLPSMIVNVAPEAGAVIVILLTEVAVAIPKTGVTNVGEVENTTLVLVVPVVPVAELR
jgi:hypothetical protein